ncbi:MAG: peroxiredoxin family protein [Pirellulales bacterium]
MRSRQASLSLAVLLFVFQHLQAGETDVKPVAAAAEGAQTSTAVAAKLPAKSDVESPSADAKPDAKTDAKPAPAAAAKPADDAKKAEPAPGHSMHGEAFDEGPRQAAYLMGGTGNVHFPVTTHVPEAQKFFDQGIGQLHGFWYFEAERSFRQVLLIDPNCAMAYWGMAMANTNNEKRANELIKKAQAMKANAGAREIAWIDALAASYDGEDTPDRRRKYVRDLESILQQYPNDVEAKALLALRIWQNGSWMTEEKKQLPISSHQAVDALLDQVFAANPMHPAHHFRVHLWDQEKAARALISASQCGQAAPSIAHMWHMPGHTYSKLHRYADGALQQEASARVDHAHMMRDRVLPDQIHNYAHNNEWLIRNLAFLGRVNDAIALATNMIELPRHPQYNNAEKGSARFGHDRLADVLLQYERWEDILRYADTSYLQPQKDDTDAKLQRLRMLGLAQFGLTKHEEGAKQIAAVEALLGERRAARYKAADEAEAKARADKKSDKDVAKAMAGALTRSTPELKEIEHVLAELRGHAALAVDKPADAKAEFEKIKEAKATRKDHLARAFSLAGDQTRAETLARKAVEDGPNEVTPLAVLVEVLVKADKKADARAEFARLRVLAADADLDNRVFERLRPLADELNLPIDWRIAREPALDVGVRPDLESLGPFRWQPTPATSWTLAGASGQSVSLDDYRGRPVVVIFYLGSGCLHCVEQLQKFAPLASKYAEAGISLVAISSEPLDTLQGSLAKLSPKEPIPFPLAADPELTVFKDYRAYDDFEKMPLHATCLIDGGGLVRWHDVSFEPFSDAEFLLGEAKRLLGKK